MHHLIFLIDPDTRFRISVTEECDRHGYVVRSFTATDDIIRQAEAERPSLFLLNAQVYVSAGSHLCDILRRNPKFSQTAIIVLSDSESHDECVQFLNNGADDYLPKTINPRELALRIRAIIRRFRSSSKTLIRIGRLEVDAAGMSASINGKSVTLSVAEFRILEYLARNVGRPVPREELLQQICLKSTAAGLRRVDSLVCRLREKVEPSPSHPIYIQTVLKIGYCLPVPSAPSNN